MALDLSSSPTHHELSLYAYIPVASYQQTLRVLSSLTLTKPATNLTHHLLYKPSTRASLPTQGTSKPLPELYYIQLIAPYTSQNPREQRWSIRLEDTPEVTRKPVVSRQVLEAATGEGDVIGFMGALGYT